MIRLSWAELNSIWASVLNSATAYSSYVATPALLYSIHLPPSRSQLWYLTQCGAVKTDNEQICKTEHACTHTHTNNCTQKSIKLWIFLIRLWSQRYPGQTCMLLSLYCFSHLSFFSLFHFFLFGLIAFLTSAPLITLHHQAAFHFLSFLLLFSLSFFFK